MESIYYVMTWLCHRACRHCYDDRFRPYHGEDLRRVVDESRANFPRIIASFPERLTFVDPPGPAPDGGRGERRGRVILAGGEILLDPVRESVLYPALELLGRRYRAQGGVRLVVQTTGDVVRPAIVEQLLERDVWMISVSGVDEFHDGLESADRRTGFVERLSRLFESLGLRPYPGEAGRAGGADGDGPWFQFFGAQPGSWIGPLWPRGRALDNGLSTATIHDNFCDRWSGGLNFLEFGRKGAEVAVEPDGSVYPCCLKTRKPLGSLLEEPLESILRRLRGDPVYEAINAGHPERMGLSVGWSVEDFLAKSRLRLPGGGIYENLCVGCDRFHEEVLGRRSPAGLTKPQPCLPRRS